MLLLSERSDGERKTGTGTPLPLLKISKSVFSFSSITKSKSKISTYSYKTSPKLSSLTWIRIRGGTRMEEEDKDLDCEDDEEDEDADEEDEDEDEDDYEDEDEVEDEDDYEDEEDDDYEDEEEEDDYDENDDIDPSSRRSTRSRSTFSGSHSHSSASTSPTVTVYDVAKSLTKFTGNRVREAVTTVQPKYVPFSAVLGLWKMTQKVGGKLSGKGSAPVVVCEATIELRGDGSVVTSYQGQEMYSEFIFKERAWPRSCSVEFEAHAFKGPYDRAPVNKFYKGYLRPKLTNNRIIIMEGKMYEVYGTYFWKSRKEIGRFRAVKKLSSSKVLHSQQQQNQQYHMAKKSMPREGHSGIQSKGANKSNLKKSYKKTKR